MPKYGFSFDWMYHQVDGAPPAAPDLPALDFLARHGFNLVRLPVSYWFWTKQFEYRNLRDRAFDHIDRYIQACSQRGLQLCISLHRAPGHCIDAPGREQHNLWLDAEAQSGFGYLWEYLAARYKEVSSVHLGFELISDPWAVGEHGLERTAYEKLMRQTATSIRRIDPHREIFVTGLDRGNEPLPELDDLTIIQSCHGYQPMSLTHHQTIRWGSRSSTVAPVYPDTASQGITWNRPALQRHFAPWCELEANGTPVLVSDFGCSNNVDNDSALAWFGDLLGLFHDYGWGYCLGSFTGQFGLVNHGRPGARYENLDGFQVDRDLFALLVANRTGAS